MDKQGNYNEDACLPSARSLLNVKLFLSVILSIFPKWQMFKAAISYFKIACSDESYIQGEFDVTAGPLTHNHSVPAMCKLCSYA